MDHMQKMFLLPQHQLDFSLKQRQDQNSANLHTAWVTDAPQHEEGKREESRP